MNADGSPYSGTNGVSATYSLSGTGNEIIFPGLWTESGSTLTVEVSDLPAHTMLRATWHTSFSSVWPPGDSDTLEVDVGGTSVSKTWYIPGPGPGATESTSGPYGRWIEHDDDALTLTFSTDGFESAQYDVVYVSGITLQIYQPTVSVTGGGEQDEDDDTPIDFTVSRDLPTDYNATYDQAIPNTTVNVTRGGTATYGDDYTGNLPTSTTTLTGTSANVFSVVPVWDYESPEDDETVTLTATTGSGYNLSGSASATAEILNTAPTSVITTSTNLITITRPGAGHVDTTPITATVKNLSGDPMSGVYLLERAISLPPGAGTAPTPPTLPAATDNSGNTSVVWRVFSTTVVGDYVVELYDIDAKGSVRLTIRVQ